MKLKQVTLQNYGSFAAKHVFQLADRGLVIVLGDNRDERRMNSNGSGKSTLFDAVDWALFGKVPRGDHVDSVVHERAGKEPCLVVVELATDDHGGLVQISRGRQPKVLELVVNGSMMTALDDDETQKRIESVLGLDRDVFHAAVLFGQTDLFRFADSTSDVERMDILTKILQLEDIDAWLERFKAEKQRLDARWGKLESERAVRAAKLEALTAELAGIDHQVSTWEAERAEALRTAMKQLDEHRTSIAEHEKVTALKARVEASFAEAQARQRETPALDLSAFDRPLGEARDKLGLASGEMHACTRTGTTLNTQIEQFQKLGVGRCLRCGQQVSAEHIQKEVAALVVERDRLREEYRQAAESAKALQAEVDKLEKGREEQRRLHYEADKALLAVVAEARAQLEHVRQSETYLAQAKAHVERLQAAMAETHARQNPWRTREADIRTRLAELQQTSAAQETQLAVDKERGRMLDFWVEACGPKGLKSYILDTKLQEMTDAANQWVRVLTGGTIWVRFETQTQGRTTKTLRNQLNIRVFRYNPDGSISERNYRSMSGGEKQRVSLGIDFGLSRLIAKRAKQSYDVLILDELFKHLDQAGREAVIEMLHQLRQEKSSVFCIDHDSDFQGAFDRRVVITKQNGQSWLMEESDAQKPSTTPSVDRVPARHPVSAGSEQPAG